MKNMVKFFGIIALVAIAVVSISSCDLDLKGGKLVILNDTGGPIYVRFSETSPITSVSSAAVSNGSTASMTRNKDGRIYYGWARSLSGVIYTGVEEVSGGKTVTIRAD